jgi:hypothetical protein
MMMMMMEMITIVMIVVTNIYLHITYLLHTFR